MMEGSATLNCGQGLLSGLEISRLNELQEMVKIFSKQEGEAQEHKGVPAAPGQPPQPTDQSCLFLRRTSDGSARFQVPCESDKGILHYSMDIFFSMSWRLPRSELLMLSGDLAKILQAAVMG